MQLCQLFSHGFSVKFDVMGVVHESVQHGICQRRISIPWHQCLTGIGLVTMVVLF